MTTLYVHIFGKGSVQIVAIYDQARSYIIKLRNWLNSFSTLCVHIFGSVHAMPMKTYCIMPITVGPFCLTHPVNFPCGRKPEYPEETHDFRQSVDFYSFHMRTGFESH